MRDIYHTLIVYVDDQLVTCRDETIIAGVIEALKTKYPGMSLDMSAVGVWTVNMSMIIAVVLKDVKFGSVVTQA